MKIETTEGWIYKIGDLRLAGPINEVDEFLDWLKHQPTCYIFGYDDIPSVRGIKSIEISIDCRLSFDEMLEKYVKDDIKYGLATPAPPGTGNEESSEIEF